jgi:type IV pilus assembly protein PilM
VLFRGSKQTDRQIACGIDIGAYAIKLVALERCEAGLAFRHVALCATPADTIQDEVIVKPRVLAAHIQQMVRESRLPIRAASIAIPVEQAMVKWINLPRMSRSEMRAAASFEATKFLPYPVEKAEIGIVASDDAGYDDSGNMRALFVAAPRDVARSRAETLEMAGLSVVGAELESFALLRALRESEGAPKVLWRGQPVAYVQMGHRVSSLCVLQDTDLRFVRGIAWGGERLTQAFADQTECDATEAQEIKERADSTIDESGVFHWHEGANIRLSEAFVPELDRLRREIQRLLNYYRSLFPERSYEGILDKVVLCGGAAGLNGLAEYFTRVLRVEVSIQNPLHIMGVQDLPIEQQTDRSHSHGFAVAIGSALGELQELAATGGHAQHGPPEFVWRRKAA